MGVIILCVCVCVCISSVQKQCCLSSLKESQCESGMTSARRGDACEVDQEDQCTDDSYQVHHRLASSHEKSSSSVVFQKFRHLPWICFIRHHAAESGREEIRERWLSCDWKAWHHGWMMPTFPAHQVKQTLNWLKVVTFTLRIEDELFLSQVQCDSLFQNGSRQWKWTVPPSGPVLWILYNDMVRADCASVIQTFNRSNISWNAWLFFFQSEISISDTCASGEALLKVMQFICIYWQTHWNISETNCQNRPFLFASFRPMNTSMWKLDSCLCSESGQIAFTVSPRGNPVV